ncbi:MAG: DUF7662 domain-containing protein [Candidatus Bathyarchaeales archaeon]
MPIKDECGICGRILPYRYLRKCQRCGRLYCIDCMVPEVSTGDTSRMLCLNCARKIVSPKTMGKYDGLRNHLKFRAAFTDIVRLSFAQIDGIIGDNLPISAYRNEEWWSNSLTNAHAKAWLDAGWKVQEVDLKNGYVIFQKVKELAATSRKSEKRRKTQEIKPFTPVPAKLPKPRTPSKTKIAKLYARIKNIERQKTAMPKYPRSFKPKPTHEKKLFKPNQKPQ